MLGEADIVLGTSCPTKKLNINTKQINQKSGDNFAVCEIYLPFVGVFNLMVITILRIVVLSYSQKVWYEMVYVTKLWEIHQCCGCKEMLKGFVAGHGMIMSNN